MSAKRWGWALLALTLMGCDKAPPPKGYAGLSQGSEGYGQVVPGRPFDFAVDHGPHTAFRIEWWYVTANLVDDAGEHYGVQWTLFRNALRPGPAGEGWSDSNVWLGHAALTSATRQHSAQRVARGGVGQAGAAAAPFSAWIDNWSLTSVEPAAETLPEMQMRAQGADFAYDLTLRNQGPMILQGEEGFSRKSDQGQASYYYSAPMISTEGWLEVDGKRIHVTGSAWLDREWSSQPLADDQPGWDWFALHLQDGNQLMLYRMRRRDGADFLFGNWIDASGNSQAIEGQDIQLTPKAITSQQGREIPTTWALSIPSRDLEVTIQALNTDSWMNVSPPYWEGPVQVEGNQTGVGYMEMTGYEGSR